MLSDDQIDRLITYVRNQLESWEPRKPLPGEIEENFTESVVLPFVQHLVRNVRLKSLLVNGDGGTQPNHIYHFNTSFRPDLEIVESFSRYIAFEVKLISEVDPSGSISKAFGQAVVYRMAAHKFAFSLLFDCRSPTNFLSLTSTVNIGEGAIGLIYGATNNS
jgi:hypothetical protein